MRNWALFLHFYQPSTQDTALTKHVLEASYLPVLDLLLDHPEQRFSVNISGSLILQLEKIHANSFFDKVQTLAERNQIELVNSPVHHPIAPLTPWNIVSRQLEYDYSLSSSLISNSPSDTLFLAELAIDHLMLQNIEKSNKYRWCLVDESTVHPQFELDTISGYRVAKYKNLLLPVSSRSLAELLRAYPTWINQHKLIDFIYEQTPENDTIISGNDVELFGHHYEERIHVFSELLKMEDRIKFVTVSEAIEKQEPLELELKKFTPSSWQTTHSELEANTPFARWLDSTNKLQQQYHHLAQKVYDAFSTVEKPDDDIGLVYDSAKKHLDRGYASCHLYWLSNNPWWHPDFVEVGAKELVKAIRSLDIDLEIKREIEKLYAEFIHDLWQYHWSGNIEEQFRLYEKERQEILSHLPTNLS